MISNIPEVLSKSFESLPNYITDELPQALITDSSPVLIVTAGYDHTIRFWDVLQGACIATLQHNESVTKIKAHFSNTFLFFSKSIRLQFHRIKSFWLWRGIQM